MQRQGVLLPALIVLFLCLMSTAWSQAVSPGQEKTIFIGSLDFDCYRDTVQGIRTDAGYLPKRILWGLPLPGKDGKLDTACMGRTPSKKRVRQTVITYNGSSVLNGSVSFQQVNPDTLIDMVIHVHGKYKEKGKAAERDSLRSLVIFGQHSMNALPVIHIGDIRRFQCDGSYQRLGIDQAGEAGSQRDDKLYPGAGQYHYH
jgi:hypothetical protein